MCTHRIMSNVLDCNIVISGFELHSHNNVHFQTNALIIPQLRVKWYNCDTMWVVGQADDFFVYFGATPNKGLNSRSPTRPEVGGERQVREKPEGQLAKEPGEGQLAKRDAERQSRTDSGRDWSRWVSSPEWTTVRRRRQWGKWSKMSWHS